MSRNGTAEATASGGGSKDVLKGGSGQTISSSISRRKQNQETGRAVCPGQAHMHNFESTKYEPASTPNENRDKSHVDECYLALKGTTVGKARTFLSGKRGTTRSNTRRFVPSANGSGTRATVELHSQSSNRISAESNRSYPSQNVCKSSTGKRRSRTNASDGANHSVATTPAKDKIIVKRRDRRVDLLEGRSQMDRSRRTNPRKIRAKSTERSHSLLGTEQQIDSSQPVPLIDVHSHTRGRNSRDCGIRPVYEEGSAGDKHNGSGNGRENEENSGPRLRDTLPEAGRDNVSLQRGGARTRRSLRRAKHSQTSMHQLPITIQREPDNNGKGARYAASFGSPTNPITQEDVNLCFDQIPHVRRYSVICARRTSRLARPEDMNLPLHVKAGIPVMDVQKVKTWMSPGALHRLETVMRHLFDTRLAAQTEPAIKGNLSEADVVGLLDAGVIETVEQKELHQHPTLQ